MPHCTRQGVQLFYRTYGMSNGIPLVLTHGMASSSLLWNNQIDTLVGLRRYHIIVWDLRGHGKSDSPEHKNAYSKMHMILDLKYLLELNGVTATRPAILCGHSMGGYDNLLFYFLFPELVLGLVLYATGPGFASDNGRLAWNEMAYKIANNYDEKGLGALVGSDRKKGHQTAIGLAHTARQAYAQQDEDALYRQLTDGTLHAARNLDKISIPTAIIVGTRDKTFLMASKFMEKKIRNAKYLEISDSGHMMAEKSPKPFNDGLVAALEHVTGGIGARCSL
eukprot:m.146100 g.146100  ORF g.146100 m.146100 type:complete len:279 (-) comp14963_c1_seq3:783-1619(-)